ncbi:MAG: pimelyl-ACP methyl ester esterase BioV [Aliarcobacter sp.]|nr:pimelyl-ACP methyl ester esterase BioV [Aliarcobacter sp.]
MRISKNYFSGFCFVNEAELFEEYIIKNDFILCGFSYGAIKAFEEALNTSKRVDKLQLFSPAFFQNFDDKFKRTQLMYFKKDPNTYCENFLKNVVNPSSKDIKKYFNQGTAQELQELLYYEWREEKLQKLLDKGTKIEVYLGAEDKIVDSSYSKDFFVNFATVYYIKEKGHLL